MFNEKQKIDVKQDTTLNIKWESEPDMIDVSGDITDIPPDHKEYSLVLIFNYFLLFLTTYFV